MSLLTEIYQKLSEGIRDITLKVRVELRPPFNLKFIFHTGQWIKRNKPINRSHWLEQIIFRLIRHFLWIGIKKNFFLYYSSLISVIVCTMRLSTSNIPKFKVKICVLRHSTAPSMNTQTSKCLQSFINVCVHDYMLVFVYLCKADRDFDCISLRLFSDHFKCSCYV